ncbi:MAG TPA: histidine kinase N-terminal 7TM domain-containing protein, partial [Thermotogota bacterium]|nr:histidine kinase N-terminal 7TM domain-containing protein [Thermotogota bacterium]
AAYSLKKRATPGSVQMAWLMAASAVWCFTSIFEALGTSLDQKVTWSVLSYLGSQTTPVFFMLFTFRFTRRDGWFKPKLVGSLFVLPAISLGMAITNSLHHLLWSSVSLEPVSGGVAGVYGHGPWFFVVVVYGYLMVFSALVLLFRFIFSHANLFSLQARMVFLGCLFPFAANILYAFDTRLIGGFDPTPLSFTVSNVFLALAAFRYRMLDLAPVAWEQVARSLEDGLLVVDEQDRIVEWNQALGRWLHPDARWVSRKLSEVLPEWGDLLQLVRESKVRKEIELQQSGIQVLEISVTPLKDRKQHLIGKVLLFHDISEQKRIQKELQQARALADAANRSKSDFLATMSHEIRNPLHGMEGLLFLVEQTSLSSEQKGYLDSIHSGMKTLGSILSDILDLSKIEAGKLELEETVFSLEEMVYGVANLFQASALEKRVSFRVQVAEKVKGNFRGDPLRIGQILSNFLTNALKFTSTGSITLGVTCGGNAKTLDGCSFLEFSVRDTGIGMDPEQQKKIFQDYSQGDLSIARKFGGTGLGLAISKNLAEKMRGKILFSSEPGRGSTFSLEVPLKRQEGETTLPPRRETKSQIPGVFCGKRVLLVEDDPVNRGMMKGVFQKFGVNLECAHDGKTALQLVSSKPFDLVLMDMHLPDMDGSTLARKILHETTFSSPVVTLSASVSALDREKCLQAGVSRFLVKPLSPLELKGVLLEMWSEPEPGEDTILWNPELLAHLHIKDGLEMLGGDKKTYLQVLGTFLDSLEKDLRSFASLRSQRDPEQIAKLVHRIKGAAFSVGAHSLGTLCEKVEQVLQGGSPEECQKDFEEFEQQMRGTVEAMRNAGLTPS